MDEQHKKGRKVTIVDVAEEAGVSYSTVSRVINNYEFVKPSTRRRVQQAMKQLGYTPNQHARSLAGGHSQIIGLLVPTLDNSYMGEIIRGIDEELAMVEYDLMLYTTHRNKGKESNYVKTITNGLVDGLLLIVPLTPIAYLDALKVQNFPYVLIDQVDQENSSPVIDATNRQGAYDATRYLIALGHTRIGFVVGLRALSSAEQRLEGYKAALADSGIPYNPALVVEGDFLQPSGYTAAQELLALPELPTAIFSSNDVMAFGVMDALRDRGLRIPEDISVVGFDDIPHASLSHPKLTTVRQPLDQMGRIAARLLLDQIENPGLPVRRITLETELIIRESCHTPHRAESPAK